MLSPPSMLPPSMNSPLTKCSELQPTDSESSFSSHHRHLNKSECGAHFSSTKKDFSAVRAIVPRSAEQSSRLLLSNAFRYDTMEAEQNRKHIQENKKPLLTVRLHFLSLSGSFFTSCSSSGEGLSTITPTSEKKKNNGDTRGEVEETAEDGATRLNDRSGNEKRSKSTKKEAKKASKEREISKKKKQGKNKGRPTENENSESDASSGHLHDQNCPSSTTLLPSAVPFSSPASLFPSSQRPVEVNIAIFDSSLKLFVTSAYRMSLDRMEREPLVFQASPHQLVVVELLTCVRIPPCLPQVSCDEERRVMAWGFCEVQSLENRESFPLCAGNGQLLYIDPKLWPREATLEKKENQLGALKCIAQVNQDRALIRLMTELVPPGRIVPHSFALDIPHPHGSKFQVEIESIALQASSRASEAEKDELMNPETQWSVAVVAHNGYQQLSEGDEVPLRFPKRRRAKPHKLGKGMPREKANSQGRKERENDKNEAAQAKKKRSSSSSPRSDAIRGSQTGVNGTSLYSTGSYTTYDRSSSTSSTSSSTSSSYRDVYGENDDDAERNAEGKRERNTKAAFYGNSGGYSLFTKKGEKREKTSAKEGRRGEDASTGRDTDVPPPSTKEGTRNSVTTSHSPKKKESFRNDRADAFGAGPRSVSSPLFKGLESQYPIVLSSLPVHGSTSIVLAIRRRRLVVSTHAFHTSTPPSPTSLSAPADGVTEVVGFCVFPLCLLPMKDRDVRVENLPALQGPFSCKDARLLLAESATPYSPLPFTLTLSLAFRGTTIPGERTIEEDIALKECLEGGKPKESDDEKEQVTRRKEERHRKHHREEKKEVNDRETLETVPIVPDSIKTEGTRSEDVVASTSRESVVTVLPSESKKKSSITTTAALDLPRTLPAGREESIFTLLHQLMKELHEVRVRQDEMIDAMVLSSSSSRHLSPSLQARINSKVTSSGNREEEAVSVIDLRPVPVAVPWQIRQQIMDAAQPVTHPILGHSLSEFSRADRRHTRSLFGFRLEGLTLDSAFHMPEDVCFLFSFGPLPFQKVGPAQTIRVSANNSPPQNAGGAPLMNVLLHTTPREELEGRRDEMVPNKTSAEGEKELQKSYRFVDSEGRGGFVWMEPVDSSVVGVPPMSMEYFKQYHSGRAVLYLHIYDALTMFYVCTAPIPFSHFYRPYHAEAALIPMDLSVQRDLSLTAQPVPEQVFPIILHAGQLHVTLVCVGVPPESSTADPSSFPSPASGGSYTTHGLPIPFHRLVEPQNGSRLVLATKLPVASPFLSATEGSTMSSTGRGKVTFDTPASAAEALMPNKDESTGLPTRKKMSGDNSAVPPLPPPPLRSSMAHHRHWQRAEVFKKVIQLQREMGLAPTPLPGVPDAHLRLAALQADPTTMEYRLRLIERERDIAKSRAITTALKERITIRHEMCMTSWRPETLQTPFVNPFHTAVTFTVDIPPSDLAHCSTSTRSFILGPMERTSIPLVVRLYDKGMSLGALSREGGGGNPSESSPSSSAAVVKLFAKVYASPHQLIRVIEIVVSILPPQIDRRLEVYGLPGTTVTKKFFSRQYSASSLPSSCKSVPSLEGSSATPDAVSRLSLLCAAVTCSSSATTTAKAVAMLDPITQHYVTAWEEVVLTTSIPMERGEQRLEYVTLYQDAACTQTLEVWELCVFPCYAVTTREIPWGQTTTIALPADDSEDLYCSSSCVKVEDTSSSYLLHIRPTAVGSEEMLLHTLQNGSLVKTLLTVPVAYPTPTATQVIELSMDDVQNGPVQRRLTFVNRDDKEDHFTIRQNYTYQLFISPSRFLLAPGDVQPIHLRIGPLALPDGQLEGRWPMWIFINNSRDKTIESYYLQIVLRLHPVVPHVTDR